MESVPNMESEESKNSSKQSLESQLLTQMAAPHVLASSPVIETSFPCMKCEGKGVSKKTQCPRCLGSGKANKDFQSLLMHSLRSMIREILSQENQKNEEVASYDDLMENRQSALMMEEVHEVQLQNESQQFNNEQVVEERVSSLHMENEMSNSFKEILFQKPIVEVQVVPEVEEVKEEVLVVEVKEEVPAMTEEEMLKQIYLTELEAANIDDALLLSNMRQMMDMGYYNYKINYNLLMRNNKDLVIAVNNLCNNIISDSMF
jgi:hypothetical protein